jgi:L-ascorbate metabolism protein UlaG (beta-lactamase superfamily)
MIDRRRLLLTGILAAGSFPAAALPTRKPITLTYLGNAGWRIEDGRTVIVVDPYVTQFEHPRGFYASTTEDDGADEVLVPNAALIATHIPKADYVLATHSHSDHMLDAPTLAKRTGATIIGSEGSANLARADGVPDKQLIIVKGGEDLEFGDFSLRVIPSVHSELFAKHYNNSEFAGPVAANLKAPLHESAYHEGGTFAYLLRIAGHQILITGGMNYIEREMQGLRPDIALIGSGASRKDIYQYSARLMRALGDPPVVFPTHWDSWAATSEEKARREVDQFAAEIKAASPRTRVTIPDNFKPMILR